MNEITTESFAPVTVQVPLTCRHELHDLKRFQETGGLAPAMHDETGRVRNWQGNQLHILTLEDPSGVILRIKADSEQEAARLMREAASEALYALWKASMVRDMTAHTLANQQARLAHLMTLIRGRYGPKYDSRCGDDAIAAAECAILEDR